MNHNIESFENFAKLKTLCRSLIQNQKNILLIKELKALIITSPQSFIKVVQPTILSTFYPILKTISEEKSSFKDDEKQLIVETLKNLFDKSVIEKIGLYFNIYSFLLFEIYDHFAHKVLPIHEEYKLAIMECMTSLAKCISSDLVFLLYTKENSPKLCQMLYVALELAKSEQLRSLRIAAVKCIMAIARVLDDDDFEDLEVRSQVAEMFLFFLPGIASGLKKIALEDEKVGHKIPMVALTAWGRIITLLMQNYNVSDENYDFIQLKNALQKNSSTILKTKFKDNTEIKEYLEITKRCPQWYRDTDKKLQPLVIQLTKLTYHSHPKVRLELAGTCGLIIQNCFMTMSCSVSHLVEIVITLSEDEHHEVKGRSKEILNKLSDNLSSLNFQSLLENLEQGFYNGIISLPRKFNGIDEKEQLAALNLLTGYINLFGKHKLEQVLLSTIHLNKLLMTLIHISELEKGNISVLEELKVQDLEIPSDTKTPWKNFRCFKEDAVETKLQKLCATLAKFGVLRVVSDFLLDVIMYQEAHRKEAILILNEVISGIENADENIPVITDVLTTYIDSTFWNIPLEVSADEFGHMNSLADVQNNVIQVCLLVEGVGKIAVVLKKDFEQFLLKTLYLVLERAGSPHPLVKAAGLSALKNVTYACGYSSLTNLINTNIDYFSYHVERRLNKIHLQNNENVLDVLTVVLKYSSVDVLQNIANIIKGVFIQSCDKFKEKNATAFLRVFKIFIQCLRRWFNIETKAEPFKTKAQKLEEIEHFQVTGVNMEEESFSDDIMGKTAEEMYKEDMEKKREELDEEMEVPQVEEYKKPEPPLHIKLTVAILGRSLHFLPSKDRTRKILVLNILTDGIEVIRDWEDELLPIVHQIWSPLVQRFREFDDPLIINYSFQLLVVLAKLSKEFIRMRTTKEVLPSIIEVLNKWSHESFLKDRGAAYRYSQAYKLQIIILENLGKVLTDLDVQQDKLGLLMDAVFKYLSEKQPVPLQTAAIVFFKLLVDYDPKPMKTVIEKWEKSNSDNEYEKNIKILCSDLEKIK